MARQEMAAEKSWAEERQGPPSSKTQPLSEASHKRKGNQKLVKKRTTDCVGKPSDHDRQVSSR